MENEALLLKAKHFYWSGYKKSKAVFLKFIVWSQDKPKKFVNAGNELQSASLLYQIPIELKQLVC